MINSAKYTENGSVTVTIDGQEWSGITEASRFWPMVQEWVDEGNAIEPYATPAPTSQDINQERTRRIEAGTTVEITNYGPIPLQGRDVDQINMLGLVQAASLRLAAGDNTNTMIFRDSNNINHNLTASQMIELWSKGAEWMSNIYIISWNIKALDPIPSDYTDDSYWT